MTDPRGTSTVDRSAGGLVAGARLAYRWVLTLFLLLGAVQIFLAGFGAFQGGFDAHRMVGFTMAGVALLIVVLAVLGRVGRREIGLSILLFVLMALGQSLWAALGENSAFFGGLHALEGLAILGLAGFLQGTAIRRGREAAAG
jgi:Family of unknown function (DUF6220)